MYPMQCYPNQIQGCNPHHMQPQVNAVKIDINHPQAYGGVNDQGQVNPAIPSQVAAGPYTYPCAPIYDIPQVGQYNTPGAYPIPPIPQQITRTPAEVPAAINVVPAIQPAPAPKAVTVTPAPAPAVVPAPAPAPTAITPVPVVPVPVPVSTVPVAATVPAVPAPTVSAPVTQNVNVNPAIPAAVVDTPQNTKVAPVAPVNAQPAPAATIDVKGLMNGLTSANPDEQTAAIQKIAEVAQTDPVNAKALLNEQTFGNLVAVINADTSKLQGPNGKSDPKNLSPLEKAEINKQFAVYTLAILQKNFRDEINKEMKKNNLPDVAINDLPFIKEGIVNNLKDNPNPTIREACLSALNYVGRPEDKEVLKVLYEISAKHDANPAVRTSAQDYLSKLPA